MRSVVSCRQGNQNVITWGECMALGTTSVINRIDGRTVACLLTS